MSVPLLLAGTVAKGCNAACDRAVLALARIIVRVCWQYLHWWTFLVLSPFLALAGWLRARS